MFNPMRSKVSKQKILFNFDLKNNNRLKTGNKDIIWSFELIFLVNNAIKNK